MDLNRKPKSTYDELVSLFGKENAERLIVKHNYNMTILKRGIRIIYIQLFLRKNKYYIIIISIQIIGAIVGYMYFKSLM